MRVDRKGAELPHTVRLDADTARAMLRRARFGPLAPHVEIAEAREVSLDGVPVRILAVANHKRQQVAVIWVRGECLDFERAQILAAEIWTY